MMDDNKNVFQFSTAFSSLNFLSRFSLQGSGNSGSKLSLKIEKRAS
jgi:hypothetical protein